MVNGIQHYDYISANYGLACTADASFISEDGVLANAELFASVAHEQLYRDPWRTDYERASLIAEISGITKYSA